MRKLGCRTRARALVLLIASASNAWAAELVLPRFILTGGTYYSHELVLNLAYTGSSEAALSLTLLTAAGQPLLSSTLQPVCNPCLWELDAGQRQRKIVFGELVLAAGGFNGLKIGFGKLSTSGDVANLSLHGTSIQFHSGPFDFRAQDQPLIEVGSGLGSSPLLLFDHLPEREGNISSSDLTVDSWIELAYAGSISVDLDLYLRTPPLGAPLRSALGDDVCYPCSYHFDPMNRMRVVSVDLLIESAGGFHAPEMEIWGELAAAGDLEEMAVAAKVASTAGPFELGFESYRPVAIASRAPDVAIFCDGFEHGDLLRWGVFP